MMREKATVVEGQTYPSGPNAPSLRTFELSLRNVKVELCTLGASLTKLIVPSPQGYHDVVLGYKSPAEMYQTGNPAYLCAVVGRVANRIANGRLKMENDGKEFALAINNEPNHLHGGEHGFSRQIWDAEIIDIDGHSAVRFSLTSENGDQDYPGTVECSATYSLISQEGSNNNEVSLSLELSADLRGQENTPINLAQHSYFNLAGHDDPVGILDHTLTLPCNFYTPLDETSIPTREVKSLNDDTTMDWRAGRSIREGLEDIAMTKVGLDKTTANKLLSDRSVDFQDFGLQPFGFDHNYVVDRFSPDRDGLYVVGTLTHKPTKRAMRIRTSAPGVQLYSANYLNPADPASSLNKDGVPYSRWQGICLETQAYPDSVLVDKQLHPEFARGKCDILSPSNTAYRHKVVYDLTFERSDSGNASVFRGKDSDGNTYDSAEVMWQVEGVTTNDKSEWYDRASQYYEENCAETIDGVLGGFASITDLDLEGSRAFVKQMEQLRSGWSWSVGAAAECGAGIGRVSKGLLLPLGVSRCDLVESSPRLISAAPEYIGQEASRCRFYCQGLQDWTPTKATYSIIWVQWVFCYLADDDAISFLRRCGEALVEGGVICLKENSCDDTDFVLDRDDASVTRSVPYLLHLIKQAGLRVVLLQQQTNFPEEIFPVPMIALEPIKQT
eukprot:scaffold1551_cov166-Amphora_coffeaeformis.AAC.13